MRVLFVSDSPTVSGAELVMLSHARALVQRGDAAHVVVRRSNRRLVDVLAQEGVPATAADTFAREVIRTTINPLALIRFLRAFTGTSVLLRALIAKWRPDVLHCVSYPAVLYGVLAARGTGLPVLWHEHNIKRLHPVNRRILTAVGRRCHRVLGPSRAVTDNLAAAGVPASRLLTVYNGVDLTRFAAAPADRAARAALGLGDGAAAVALPGQLLRYKGHRVLIDAAPALVRRFAGIRFYIVGALENPPYEAELRRAIGGAGLEDRFVFTGWRADMHTLLQAMDVIVVPSTHPEPAALTLLEAMALARPLVASWTGGTPELVLDGVTGLLVPPGDSGALAAALARLLEAPSLARQLGAAGRRRVEEHFTMAGHQRAILGVYDDAATRRS
jgi:glycosyltransferase involved in cell wall biosynthesis